MIAIAKSKIKKLDFRRNYYLLQSNNRYYIVSKINKIGKLIDSFFSKNLVFSGGHIFKYNTYQEISEEEYMRLLWA